MAAPRACPPTCGCCINQVNAGRQFADGELRGGARRRDGQPWRACRGNRAGSSTGAVTAATRVLVHKLADIVTKQGCSHKRARQFAVSLPPLPSRSPSVGTATTVHSATPVPPPPPLTPPTVTLLAPTTVRGSSMLGCAGGAVAAPPPPPPSDEKV